MRRRGKEITPWEDISDREDDIKNYYGFIYEIKNKKTGRFYIGKKALVHKRGRKLVESDWKTYKSSNKYLLKDISELGVGCFTFTIFEYHKTKKKLTYYENYHLYANKVLLNSLSYNDNISGKFFKKDLV